MEKTTAGMSNISLKEISVTVALLVRGDTGELFIRIKAALSADREPGCQQRVAGLITDSRAQLVSGIPCYTPYALADNVHG